jgi:hypothetical protein
VGNPQHFRPPFTFKVGDQVFEKVLREMEVGRTGRAARTRPHYRLMLAWKEGQQ